MPRTVSGPEATLLDGPQYNVGLKVWIADADDTLRDYSSQADIHWTEQWSADVALDQPISQIKIALRRDADGEGVLSLSPFREDSTLNRDTGDAYAPAIDVGRRVKIEVATTAGSPSGGDWKNLFEGFIHDLDVSGPSIQITANDLGVLLQERFVEIEKEYGAADGSVEIEEVAQAIIDDAGLSITLVTPTSPGFAIKPYKQSRQPVLEALNTLAALIGWTVRYWWSEADSEWQLQLRDPDRTKTTPDRTYAPSKYFTVDKLEIATSDVRNFIRIWYWDTDAKLRLKVDKSDAASILRYGRQFMEIDLASDSPINTAAEVNTLGDAIIADLKDPKAEQQINMLFDWSVELNDLIRFTANGVHYDVDQDWAVVGYQHSLSVNSHRTTVLVRGKPAGRYAGWLDMANLPNQQPATVGPTLIVNADITAADVQIDVRHTGVLTLSTDGGLTFGDPADDPPGITEFPHTVDRPDGSAGEGALRWVFKASLNGQEVTHPVDIPATDAGGGPKPPPDSAYGTTGPATTVVAVHAGYLARITLTDLPSARTELDEGTRFRIDATSFVKARVTAHVVTAAPEGAQLILEYFNPDSSTWEEVAAGGCFCPIDATGTQAGELVVLFSTVTGDLVFRLVTEGGDGAEDPVLGNVHVQFVGAEGEEVARAGILYLRELTPSSSPTDSEFPFSEAIPDEHTSGTSLTASADTVRALRPTKGTDTTGQHVKIGLVDYDRPRDLFPGAWLSEPFAVDQAVAAGPWELVIVGEKNASHDYAIPMMAIYLLRLITGTWTKVATIYDDHHIIAPATNWTYHKPKVSRKTVSGASFDAEAGDVLALEVWFHYDRQDGYATGHAQPDVDDGLAKLYYDGADDIGLSLADAALWPAGSFPASYLKPPVSLALETPSSCVPILTGDAISSDFEMGLCDIESISELEALSQQNDTTGTTWPEYVSGKRAVQVDSVTWVEDPTAANGHSYILLTDDNALLSAYQNFSIAFPVETYPNFWVRFLLRDIDADYGFGLSLAPFFAGISFLLNSSDDKIHLKNYTTLGGVDEVTPVTDVVSPTDILEFAYHVHGMTTNDVPGAINKRYYNATWDLYVKNRTTNTVYSVLGTEVEEYSQPVSDNNANPYTDWILVLLNQVYGVTTQLHGWEFVDGSAHSNPFGY